MKNKIFLLTAGALFIYGVVNFALFVKKTEPGLSTLISEHTISKKGALSLLKGDKVNFEVSPQEDNLGIIAVRFQTYSRINDDSLIFRIRQKNSSIWMYTAQYKTDQFQDHELFPFGFPIIADSKGKTYQIELESLGGTNERHVSVDTVSPVIVSKYHYGLTSSLPLKKIVNFLTTRTFAFPLLTYLSPLLLYLWISASKRKRTAYLSIIIPGALIFSRLLLNLPTPYHWMTTLIVAWLIYLVGNNVSIRVSVSLSLAFSLYLLWLPFSGNGASTEVVARWLYLSLLIIEVQLFAKAFVKKR